MFANLSIRALLTWALGVFLVLFLVAGIAGYQMLAGHRVEVQSLIDNNIVRGDQAHRLASDLLRGRVAAFNAIVALKDSDVARARDIVQRAQPFGVQADASIARLSAAPDTSAEGAPLYRDMMSAYQAYRQQAYDPLLAAAGAGQLAQALDINEQQVAPLGDAFTRALLAYVDYASRYGDALANDASLAIDRALIVMEIGGLVVLLLIGALFYVFNRRVFEPLRQAGQLFERMAAGDLTGRITVASRNEIGTLFTAIGHMQDSLVRTVGSIRTGAEAISSASRQIAAGNADLSARTESQAASLEQTAASMEEMASTVQQNADNARQADELATQACAVALRGGTAVGDVVQTMSAISASSNKISEIVTVIDSIAFQTNILALNAAVEAARAGDQGKGFAVVAGEVRSLAQRSANAAKEIKGLIEESVSKVDVGAAQVERAGATMQEIVTSVKHVADIMAEITLSSEEQARGVSQVNVAIAQMDEVTQQNAALVEEAAAAAAALQDQAGGLVGAVSTFRLHAAAVLKTPDRYMPVRALPSAA